MLGGVGLGEKGIEMMANQLLGLHYLIHGNAVVFFGLNGNSADDDKGVRVLSKATVNFTADRDAVMSVVRECIASDVENGNGDNIAQLQLGPREAILFFIEGILSPDHFKRDPREGVDFFDVYDVEVEHRLLTVRVYANPACGVATADIDGNLL